MAIDLYVRRRRQDGADYMNGQSILQAMCRRTGDQPISQLSIEDVLRFLDNPRISAITRKAYYSTVSRFLRFWACRHAMPTLMLPRSPRSTQTFIPHIYTHAQIRRLLSLAKTSQKQFQIVDGSTVRMFLLTLYATGALTSELLNLSMADLDFERNEITFRGDRRTRKRSIPIGAHLRDALQAFVERREIVAQNKQMKIFCSASGLPLSLSYMNQCFARLKQAASVVRSDSIERSPRLHDFRATFAVHRLTEWIQNGADLNRLLPGLSAYMGYTGLAATERYLSLTPQHFVSDLQKLNPLKTSLPWRDDPATLKFLRDL